jgi:hypothetical protein
MTFMIEDIMIDLTEENGAIRLTADTNNNVILSNQSMAFVENIVKENFQVVKSHYQKKSGDSVDNRDLNNISLKIVLQYLYMYNMWRRLYEKEKDRDLKFVSDDFEHPATHDMIIGYFKNKYPGNYSVQCAVLLGMSTDRFKKYEEERERSNDR